MSIKNLLLTTVAAVATSSCASVLRQDSVEFDQTRTLYVNTVISKTSLDIANQIMNLAEDPSKPIDLVINSPGGVIIFGDILIASMEAAKSRGITIRCVVPVIAASMAFSILDACSERYIFDKSLLLFHPASTSAPHLAAKDAKLIYDELDKIDRELVDHLVSSMGIDRDLFLVAFYEERLWTGRELADVVRSGYYIIIRDIRGIKNPFSVRF